MGFSLDSCKVNENDHIMKEEKKFCHRQQIRTMEFSKNCALFEESKCEGILTQEACTKS